MRAVVWGGYLIAVSFFLLILFFQPIFAQDDLAPGRGVQQVQKKRLENGVDLRLVSARDHIEGSFVGNQTVYADRDRIYLASNQGRLFVLGRDRRKNFPLLQTIQVTRVPLSAVRGDANHLYVISADGRLRIFRKEQPLELVETVHITDYALLGLEVLGETLYVSEKFAHLAVDNEHLFFSQLNAGEMGFEVNKKSHEIVSTYGQQFEPNTTVVYDRISGKRAFGIANPRDLAERPSSVNIYADGQVLVHTVPGCCGTGVYIYSPKTFALEQTIALPFANSVVRSNNYLITGTEDGQVNIYGLRSNPSPLLSTVDLRQITGHTGSEDIEIRALWKDDWDNLIFAASSWGNEHSRGPALPSLFVLEIVKPAGK